MVRLMNTGDDLQGPINLGNSDEFTVIQLAQVVIRLTGSYSEIVYPTLPFDDLKQCRPDTVMAREKLAWQASTSLVDGVSKTIRDFAARIGLKLLEGD